MENQDASAKKSPYSKEELTHFEQLLEDEHQETKEKIEELQDSIDDLQGNQEDENSAAAHHQGDIASEEDEREKYLIMIEKENNKIEEINEAMERIENGTYGVCEETGEKIQKQRLEAIPYARYSMKAQKERE